MINKTQLLKRFFITCLLVLPVFAWIVLHNDKAPSAQTTNTATSTQTYWQVLSPMKFTRSTGEPVEKSFTFSAIEGVATILLTNGNLEDSTVERVSSSVITVNGQVIFGPSEFNQNVQSLEKSIGLVEGQNTLTVLLKGKPGSQVTIQMLQAVPEITAEITLLQAANALRAGNIDAITENFVTNDEQKTVLGLLSQDGLNDLANCIESGVLIMEGYNFRSYQCEITGYDNIRSTTEFSLTKKTNGQWVISSW